MAEYNRGPGDLGDVIRELRDRIRSLETSSQLANSSIESGYIAEKDQYGNLVSQYGEQFDGTHTAASLSGPTPPIPTAPTANAALGGVNVDWDGDFTNGEITPMDFSRVEIHVSSSSDFEILGSTLVATIETPQGGSQFISRVGTATTFVKLITRSQSGKASAPSFEAYATPLSAGEPSPPEQVTDLVVSSDWDYNSQNLPAASFDLSWSEVTDNEDQEPITVSSYEVWTKKSSESDWGFAASVNGTSTTVRNFALDTQYDFKVRAVSTVPGDFSWSVTAEYEAANVAESVPQPPAPAVGSRYSNLYVQYLPPLVDLPGHVDIVEIGLKDSSGGMYEVTGSLTDPSNISTSIISLDAQTGTEYWVAARYVTHFGTKGDWTDASTNPTALQNVVDTDLVDTTIFDAIDSLSEEVSGVQQSADGKSTIYYSPEEPTAPSSGFVDGDTWFDTDDDNKIYVWADDEWSPAALGTNALGDSAITNAKIANIDAAKITSGTIDANRIGAKSITADKVLIGTPDNVFPDTLIEDVDRWQQSDGVDFLEVSRTNLATNPSFEAAASGTVATPVVATQADTDPVPAWLDAHPNGTPGMVDLVPAGAAYPLADAPLALNYTGAMADAPMTASNATQSPVQSTYGARSGGVSVAVVPTGIGGAASACYPANGFAEWEDRLPFEPDKTYTVSAYVTLAAPQQSPNLLAVARALRVRESGGSNPGTLASAQAPNTAGRHRVSVTFTVPAVVTGSIAVELFSGSDDPADLVWWDDLLIEETAEVHPYFDGNTSDAGSLHRYVWQDETNRSTSDELVRRETPIPGEPIPYVEEGAGRNGETAAVIPASDGETAVAIRYGSDDEALIIGSQFIEDSSFRLRAWVYSDVLIPADTVGFRLYTYDASDGTYLTEVSYANDVEIEAGEWFQLTIRPGEQGTTGDSGTNRSADVRYMLLSLYSAHDSDVYFSAPSIAVGTSGSLIVDGSITSRTIATEAITSDKLAVNSVTAGNIAAGTIRVDKLAVGSSANIVADPNFDDPTSWVDINNNPIGTVFEDGVDRILRVPASDGTTYIDAIYGGFGTPLAAQKSVPIMGGTEIYLRVSVTSDVAIPYGAIEYRMIDADTGALLPGKISANYPANVVRDINGKSIANWTGVKNVTLCMAHKHTSWVDFFKPSAVAQITGNLIVDGAIDGKTITGAVIRTSSSSNRVELSGTSFKSISNNTTGVEILPGGMTVYNGGTVRCKEPDGQTTAWFGPAYVSGSDPLEFMGYGLAVTDYDGAGLAWFLTGENPEDQTGSAAIYARNDTPLSLRTESGAIYLISDDGDLNIDSGPTSYIMSKSGDGGAWFGSTGSGDALFRSTGTGSTHLASINGQIQITCDNDHMFITGKSITFETKGGDDFNYDFYTRFGSPSGNGLKVRITNRGSLGLFANGTASGAANVHQDTNGYIRKSTSSIRYKQDVEDHTVDIDAFKQMRSVSWRDKGEVAENSDTTNRYVGFIAEEVDTLGLSEFVSYNADGEPDAISYDRLAVGLLQYVNEQQREIDELKELVNSIITGLPSEMTKNVQISKAPVSRATARKSNAEHVKSIPATNEDVTKPSPKPAPVPDEPFIDAPDLPKGFDRLEKQAPKWNK